MTPQLLIIAMIALLAGCTSRINGRLSASTAESTPPEVTAPGAAPSNTAPPSSMASPSSASSAIPKPTATAAPSATPAPTTAPTASPTAPTTSSNCSPAFGTYTGSMQPPACWRPYNSTSPFNIRVSSKPTLDSKSATYVSSSVIASKLSSGYFGMFNHVAGASGYDYAHPIFWSKATDPLYTISSCFYSDGSTVGLKVRIPQAARPAQGTDGHMTVIDQSTGMEFDFYNFPLTGPPAGGGNVSMRGCSHSNAVTGSGIAHGTTAAGFTNLAGVIRPEEMAAGVINHALFAVVDCVQGYVFPAQGGAYACPSGTSGPPNGAHFWLDYTDTEIANLGLKTWEKAVVTALAHYGAYVGDTAGIGGTNGMSFQTLGTETYVALGLADPFVQIAKDAGIAVNPTSKGGSIMSFKITAGKIDWAHRLHVLAPCVAQGTCQ